MTWEIWYARILPQPPSLGDSTLFNSVMATYADNHNTDEFVKTDEEKPWSSRRRNIGVYIQPSTGQLSLGTFLGDVNFTLNESAASNSSNISEAYANMSAKW